MDDQEVIDRINQLDDEEHELFGKESRARKAAGSKPDQASVRDEKTVEGYIG